MNKRGFTLIELLLSLSLFLMAFVFLAYSLKSAKVALRASLALQTATLSLKNKTEEISTLGFAKLPLLQGSSFASGSGQILVKQLSADLVAIELKHSWQKKKSPLRLFTLRSKHE